MLNIDDTGNAQHPQPTWLHRLWGLLPSISLIVLVGVIVLLAAQIRSEGEVLKTRRQSELRQERPKTNVVTLEVTPCLLQDKIKLPGYVKPWVTLDVVAEVKGTIVEKRVAEGSRVKKGDLLALIDSRDYQHAHDSARAAHALAAATEERMQRLFSDKVATQAQLDDATAAVRTAKAALDNAALALERCRIVAPMAGVVNRVYVEPGRYMDVGGPVAEILEIDRVKVVVGIPESDVDAVRRIERFTVTIDALGGKVFDGTRHYLYKTSDNFARLYNLEIAVGNPKGEILPDMFTRVNIVKTEVPDGLAVPLYALFKRNEQDAVYVVADGAAQLRPVTIGIQDGWRIQVHKGIAAGEQVVVVGQKSIEDNEAVTVTRTVLSMEELTR